MKRLAVACYGFLAYLAFLLPIGYLVGFLVDLPLLPRTVNRGAGPLGGPALTVDLALLAAFGLQHSVMARPAFKSWLERWVPQSLERSTYVLASGLTLVLLFALWRPLPAILWDVSGTTLGVLAWSGYALGWALAVAATFALSHLHLFGVAQVAARLRGREHPRMALRHSRLYRLVRHPMTAGLVLAFWSTPRMTLGHLVFAAGMTVYSLWATVLEERDLLRAFPDSYRTYRTQVPALVPLLRPGTLLPRRHGFALELGAVALGLLLLSVHLLGGLGLGRGQAATPARLPALERVELEVDGTRRSFGFFDPRAGGARRPLVLALHGTGGDGARLQGFLGGELERVAREEGWLVAYPDAWGGAWNDCRRRAPSAARAAGLDDVAFLRAVADRLVAERRADPGRVLLLGFSGGGHLAFRAALEAPDLAAAAAVFGASLPTDEDSLCRPADPVPPVLVVNGTRDLVNPYGGGEVIAPTGAVLGEVRSSKATVQTLASLVRPGGEARLMTVAGGGHAVPGPASRFPRLVGRTDTSVSGVEEAARFFRRHLNPPERGDEP